jgi:UrcA family protein
MTILLLFALSISASVPAAGSSNQANEGVELVRYRAADLAKPNGRAELHRRLKWAAQRVCAEPGPASAERYERQSACLQQALQDADRQLQHVAAISAMDTEAATTRQSGDS